LRTHELKKSFRASFVSLGKSIIILSPLDEKSEEIKWGLSSNTHKGVRDLTHQSTKKSCRYALRYSFSEIKIMFRSIWIFDLDATSKRPIS